MTKNKSFHRTVSAIAAIGATALLVSTIGPARAGGRTLSKDEWIVNVNRQLNETLQQVPSVPASERAKASVIVTARFNPAGEFVDAAVARGSGNEALDREAIRAARAVRYPALPEGYAGTDRTVAVTLFFSPPGKHNGAAQAHEAAHRLAAEANAQVSAGQ